MEVIHSDQFISIQTAYMWKAHIKSIAEDEGLEVTGTSRTYYKKTEHRKCLKQEKERWKRKRWWW
jgi:4-hydroxyphenylpyruvate dioxygenase-like putative hemolysin